MIYPEMFARADAKLRHRLLQVLEDHIQSNAHHNDHRKWFLSIESLAERTGTDHPIALGHIQVLHQNDFVHPTSYSDGIDVYTITQEGKAALVKRELLIESGERQFNFMRSWIAIVISILALGVSIIALVKSV